MQAVYDSGLSEDRVNLLWAKRLYTLKQYDNALEILNRLNKSNDLVMTYSPKKDKESYLEAYKKWKKELEIILSK